jgi:hypothetical protein
MSRSLGGGSQTVEVRFAKVIELSPTGDTP